MYLTLLYLDIVFQFLAVLSLTSVNLFFWFVQLKDYFWCLFIYLFIYLSFHSFVCMCRPVRGLTLAWIRHHSQTAFIQKHSMSCLLMRLAQRS